MSNCNNFNELNKKWVVTLKSGSTIETNAMNEHHAVSKVIYEYKTIRTKEGVERSIINDVKFSRDSVFSVTEKRQ